MLVHNVRRRKAVEQHLLRPSTTVSYQEISNRA
jgi:hypothetical protein